MESKNDNIKKYNNLKDAYDKKDFEYLAHSNLKQPIDNDGNTIVHLMAKRLDMAGFELIKSYNPSIFSYDVINLPNKKRQLPIHLALKAEINNNRDGSRKFVDYMINTLGANPDIPDNKNRIIVSKNSKENHTSIYNMSDKINQMNEKIIANIRSIAQLAETKVEDLSKNLSNELLGNNDNNNNPSQAPSQYANANPSQAQYTNKNPSQYTNKNPSQYGNPSQSQSQSQSQYTNKNPSRYTNKNLSQPSNSTIDFINNLTNDYKKNMNNRNNPTTNLIGGYYGKRQIRDRYAESNVISEHGSNDSFVAHNKDKIRGNYRGSNGNGNGYSKKSMRGGNDEQDNITNSEMQVYNQRKSNNDARDQIRKKHEMLKAQEEHLRNARLLGGNNNDYENKQKERTVRQKLNKLENNNRELVGGNDRKRTHHKEMDSLNTEDLRLSSEDDSYSKKMRGGDFADYSYDKSRRMQGGNNGNSRRMQGGNYGNGNGNGNSRRMQGGNYGDGNGYNNPNGNGNSNDTSYGNVYGNNNTNTNTYDKSRSMQGGNYDNDYGNGDNNNDDDDYGYNRGKNMYGGFDDSDNEDNVFDSDSPDIDSDNDNDGDANDDIGIDGIDDTDNSEEIDDEIYYASRPNRPNIPRDEKANEMYKSFIQKIMDLLGVTEEEARFYRSALKLNLQNSNPELRKRENDALKIKEMEPFFESKSKLKAALDKIDLKATRKNMDEQRQRAEERNREREKNRKGTNNGDRRRNGSNASSDETTTESETPRNKKTRKTSKKTVDEDGYLLSDEYIISS